MENCAFIELNEKDLLNVDGGSFWKYLGAGASIVFGAVEIYSGIGAVDGTKRIIEGGAMIVGGIIVACV